ncbi:MAG: hypothetical protein LKK46_00195 [Ancrocorticia sp.]|nr:hypothetical protein [Ancrocorticia sp.]
MTGGAGRRTGTYDLRGRSFTSVYDFMAKELGLKGTELLLYARIFGFSQAGKTFYESRTGTAEFFGCTPRAITAAAGRLVTKGLIEEVPPTPEAASLGTRCYRPCVGPLAKVGLALSAPEESSGAAGPTLEETSTLHRGTPEESSLQTAEAPEEASALPLKQVHPIPKNHNKEI